MTRRPAREAPSSLDLLEDAVHLLRATPAQDFALWFAGAGPFALGLLFFWADMSRSAAAEARLPAAALGLAFLFLWARTCQAQFAARLHARLADIPMAPLTASGWGETFLALVLWQPLTFVLLPVALFSVVLFPSFLAFHQGLIVTAPSSGGRPGHNLLLAAKLAAFQPRQNSQTVSLLAMAWLAALVNVGLVLFTLPQLAKLLLGIESHFTLSSGAVFNTTFAGAALVLATLLIDPLAKAVYVLHDFQAASATTGEDLLASLRRLRPVIAVLLVLAFSRMGTTYGAPATPVSPAASPPPAGQAIAPAELNRAISEVLDRPEFAGREPRQRVTTDSDDSRISRLARLLEPLQQALESLFKRLEGPLKSFSDWLANVLGRRGAPSAPSFQLDLSGLAEFLMWLLIAVSAIALGWFSWRIGKRRMPTEVSPAVELSALPDLSSDNLTAEQLPDEGWLALARDLAERGEHRLALRALYLASLAHLARCEVIRLERAKSNREYANEVRRRTRDRPALADTFADLVRGFERAWYGGRTVTPDGFADFAAGVDRLRAP